MSESVALNHAVQTADETSRAEHLREAGDMAGANDLREVSDAVSRSSSSRRLLAAFGANTFGRVLATVIQVVSVPMFLRHWGASLYGEWLVLIAIPSYFALSDIGFGSVAGNEMTMLMASNKADEALEVFQSVWVLTTVISCTVGALLFGCVWFVPFNRWLHLQTLSTRDVRLIVLYLGISVLFTMQETIFQAAFRCVGRYAFGTTVKNVIAFLAFGLILIPLVMGATPVTLALTQLVVNFIGTILIWALLAHEIKWIRFGVRHARWAAIRRLTGPAVSMISVPISTALSLQGMVLVVGSVLGPVAVVTFTTARTISRSANQIMNLINNSIWPEVSMAFGSGDMDLARKLHRRACQLSIVLCLGIALVVAVLGQFTWKLWTVGKIPTDQVLLWVMLFQLVVSSLWFTSAVIPIAVNKNGGMAKVIVTTSALSLGLAWAAMQVFGLGLRGAAAAVVLADLLNTVFVLKISLGLLDDSFGAFARSMLTVPRVRLPWRRSGA